jgi:hypothetical protein
MSEFKEFKWKSDGLRNLIFPLRPFVPMETLDGVHIDESDKEAGSPKVGDMIYRDPINHDNQRLMTKKYVEERLYSTGKTLDNTYFKEAKKKFFNIKVFGKGDLFQLICKTSSKNQDWKSTRAMDVGNGVVVQVSTQQCGQFAEAITYVPNVEIAIDENGNKYLKPQQAKLP